MSEIETQRALELQATTPESLEKIFLRIEEESERRAHAETLTVPKPNASEDATPVSTIMLATSSSTSRSKARRRTSISITRFGELDSEFSLNSQPSTPSIVKSGLGSPVYETYRKNDSTDTLNLSENDDDEHAHLEDDDHVTQVQRIAARQSVISRSIGTFPRRLSRARSTQLLTGGDTSNNMVIGVSVQAATVEVVNNESDDVRLGAVVHAPGSLRNQTSQPSMKSLGVSGGGGGWLARAKSLTTKLRGKI